MLAVGQGRVVLSSIVLTLVLGTPVPADVSACREQPAWTLVVHGGAGVWEQTPEQLELRKSILRRALTMGATMLSEGAPAVDVVEAVIVVLEDAPQLNAGRGGIANEAGVVELDAAIMRGQDRDAGAVAALKRVKNPIRLARAIMERSRHVMLVDSGAEAFAKKAGLDLVPPAYFKVAPEPTVRPSKPSKSGTVGAVVRDRCGHVAAGTSTGGYDSKLPGRVGDVPVIGAGTFADDASAALSATGWGEWFIRYTAAHEVAVRVGYQKLALGSAMESVLAEIKAPAGATGGFIGVRKDGTWAAAFSSRGMLHGVVTHRAPKPRVEIFKAVR